MPFLLPRRACGTPAASVGLGIDPHSLLGADDEPRFLWGGQEAKFKNLSNVSEVERTLRVAAVAHVPSDVLVPISVAARPRASFAFAPRAPKLMPAMVMGILRWIGFLAKRVPIVTSVPHFSRYPSSG